MKMTMEPRPYGPDSTPDEIELIRSRLYLYSDGIVIWRESPVASLFVLGLHEEKLSSITSGLRSYKLLVDLTEAAMPNAEFRAKLREVFLRQKKLERTAVFTGKNFLINVAAKFVLRAIHTVPHTLHSTKEEALAALGHGS